MAWYWPKNVDNLIIFILFSFLAIILIFGKLRLSFPFLVAGIIYWLEMIIYSLTQTPVIWDRTMLPSLVPLSGFLALQTATIQKKSIKTVAITIFIILSLLLTTTWVTTKAGKPREEFRQLTQLVKSQFRPNDLVIFYPLGSVQSVVQFYFPSLPSDRQILLTIKSDFEDFKAEIDEKTTTLDIQKQSHAIFLIARVPRKMRQIETINLKNKHEKDTYETDQKLLTVLESKFGVPVLSQEFDDNLLLFKKYELNTSK